MSVKISIVVAVAENNVIGFDGDMPWKLSTDLKRFKALTLGKPMIMGRKTFEAIGMALPGRTSIVVTRDKEWQVDGVVPVQSLDQALLLATEIAISGGMEEVCIVGGGQIYKQSIDKVDVLHITKVHARPEGDTEFPMVDPDIWELVSEELVPAGDRDTAATSYNIYQRRH